MEKTLKYSVHAHGELEEAISCPLGTYCVDMKTKFYYFKSAKKGMPDEVANVAAEAMAHIAVLKGAKSAVAALIVHEKFELLRKEDVKEEDDKLVYDFTIKGEMQEYVETKYGSLYADAEKEAFYFDAAKKGFMEPILKKKFVDDIKMDLNSDDEENKLGTECVMEIIQNWTELDDDDIIRENPSN